MQELDLFLNNQGLIHMVVQRFLSRGKEREELYQIGAIGLWKAAKGYDETRGFAFSTYAVPFIMGEIKMAFRGDQVIHVSRSIQENALLIEKIRQRENRPLSLDELEKMTGLTKEAIVEAVNTRQPPLSLDEPSKEEGQSLMASLGDKRNFQEEVDNRVTIEALLQKLEETERKLIVKRFFQNRTQSQVAEELGMNQVAVSRMEKRILERLRKELISGGNHRKNQL